MVQWKIRKKYKRLRTAKDRKPSTKEEKDTQDVEDIKLYKPGELLSCDNVGPVNPMSFEGYTQTFIWRDKRMFSHSDSEATEELYLEGLEEIRLYYKAKGIRIKVIRTDDFTTFKYRKLRQSSTPYQHRTTVEYPLPALAELSRARHPDDDTQHACRLLKPSAQTLDQSTQRSTKISTPVLTQRNHG